MLPLRIEYPCERRPYATLGLTLANVVVFLATRSPGRRGPPVLDARSPGRPDPAVGDLGLPPRGRLPPRGERGLPPGLRAVRGGADGPLAVPRALLPVRDRRVGGVPPRRPVGVSGARARGLGGDLRLHGLRPRERPPRPGGGLLVPRPRGTPPGVLRLVLPRRVGPAPTPRDPGRGVRDLLRRPPRGVPRGRRGGAPARERPPAGEPLAPGADRRPRQRGGRRGAEGGGAQPRDRALPPGDEGRPAPPPAPARPPGRGAARREPPAGPAPRPRGAARRGPDVRRRGAGRGVERARGAALFPRPGFRAGPHRGAPAPTRPACGAGGRALGVSDDVRPASVGPTRGDDWTLGEGIADGARALLAGSSSSRPCGPSSSGGPSSPSRTSRGATSSW